MKISNLVTLSALVLSVTAVPLNKRDIVWVTEMDMVTDTVQFTKTVWVDSLPTADASVVRAADHFWHSGKLTQPAQSSAASTANSVTSKSAVATSSSASESIAATSSSTSKAAGPITTSTYVATATSTAYIATTTSSTSVVPTTSATRASATPSTTPTPSATTTSVSTSTTPIAPTTTETPTTSAYVAPASTAASTASSKVVATTSTTAAGTVYTGDITWYATGLGSCGITNKDSDAIIALAHGMMTANWSGNPNNNPLCGKTVTISYNGVEKQATLVDTCEGCTGASIDLTTSLFQDFAPLGTGRVSGVEWWFN